MTIFHAATSSPARRHIRAAVGTIVQRGLSSCALANEFTAPAFKSATRGAQQKRDRLVFDGFPLALDNVTAQLDAFITDKHVRPGDEMPDL
jgi:hypothetical protein